MAQFIAGTSGYQYDHWVGPFYPERLERAGWFEYYAEQFDAVEINNTFYGLPDRETFRDWRDRAPEGFTYVLKYSQYGTHMKKLNDPADHVGTFLEHAEPLEKLMGPILVQLPPNWRANPQRLQAFLEAAPSQLRWAIEFRDPDWLQGSVFEVLREHNAALVIHDMIPDHPEVITTNWVYLRYHGGERGKYTSQKMSAEARRVNHHLASGLDVYAFFNNDTHGWAIENVWQLRKYVEDD